MTDRKPLGQLTLEQFFEQHYLPQRMLNARAGSKECHRSTLRQLAQWLGRQPLLHEVTDGLVARWLQYRLDSEGRSPATVNRHLRELTAIMALAAKIRRREELKLQLTQVTEDQPTPTVWTEEEVGRILQACELMRGHWGRGVQAAAAWQALLLVCYDTGGRIGAILRAGVEHVDFERQELVLPAELQKQRKPQRLALASDTMAALKWILPPHTPPRQRLLPYPHDSRTLRRHYRQILREAGLPTTRRDLFHRIRRTTSTLVVRQLGIEEGQKLLGHANKRTTEQHYVPEVQELRRAVDALPRPPRKRNSHGS